jgi:type II secretory pathway pseudopilin PulG
MADPLLPYISLLSIAITSGLLVMALINFSSARKSMQKQSEEQMNNLKILNEQQIYERITEVRLRLQNTEEFTKMAAESHVYAKRFALVDKPSE